MYTSPRERPERLYRRGRDVAPEFSGDESLFLRYRVEHFIEGQLTPYGIRSQLQQSVNRGNFSQAEDVLFSEAGEYDGLGVIEFFVAEVPPRIAQRDGPPYVFFLCHVPEETNYSHSEIWCDQEPPTGGFRKPSRTVSLEFRSQLCRLLTVERIRIEAHR